jgi:hypothetical protein
MRTISCSESGAPERIALLPSPQVSPRQASTAGRRRRRAGPIPGRAGVEADLAAAAFLQQRRKERNRGLPSRAPSCSLDPPELGGTPEPIAGACLATRALEAAARVLWAAGFLALPAPAPAETGPEPAEARPFPALPSPPAIEGLLGLPQTFTKAPGAYLALIAGEAERRGLPPAVADAVAKIESGFDPRALGGGRRGRPDADPAPDGGHARLRGRRGGAVRARDQRAVRRGLPRAGLGARRRRPVPRPDEVSGGLGRGAHDAAFRRVLPARPGSPRGDRLAARGGHAARTRRAGRVPADQRAAARPACRPAPARRVPAAAREVRPGAEPARVRVASAEADGSVPLPPPRPPLPVPAPEPDRPALRQATKPPPSPPKVREASLAGARSRTRRGPCPLPRPGGEVADREAPGDVAEHDRRWRRSPPRRPGSDHVPCSKQGCVVRARMPGAQHFGRTSSVGVRGGVPARGLNIALPALGGGRRLGPGYGGTGHGGPPLRPSGRPCSGRER